MSDDLIERLREETRVIYAACDRLGAQQMLIRLADDIEAALREKDAEIARLTQDRDDNKDDALRLHREKMDAIEARIAAEQRTARLVSLLRAIDANWALHGISPELRARIDAELNP